MSLSHLYGGSVTLAGATKIWDQPLDNFVNTTNNAVPLIGVRITNASASQTVTIYCDAVHYPGGGTGNSKDDCIADPGTWGQVVQPGQTVEYWASGGGSKPGSGMILQVYAIGTDDETVNWSAIAR